MAGRRIDEEVALVGIAGDHGNHRDARGLNEPGPPFRSFTMIPVLPEVAPVTTIRSDEELFGPARKASTPSWLLPAAVEVAADHGHVADTPCCIAGRPDPVIPKNAAASVTTVELR